MLSSPAGHPGGSADGAPRERPPSYMLSPHPTSHTPRTPSGHGLFQDGGAYTPGGQSRLAGTPSQAEALTTPPWLNATRRQGHHVAFNDRLASADGHGTPTTTPAAETPSGFHTGQLRKPSPASQRLPPSRMPPNKSLLDSGAPSVLMLRSPATPAASGASPMTGTPASFALRTPVGASPAAPGLERWVTVFGFSVAMESQVLREFRRHGEIVRTVPGKGNWVHILYRTELQAQVALYKPWRVLAGTETMVGTVPCTEPQVAREADEQIEKGILLASPSAASPYAKSAMRSPAPAQSALRTPASMLRRDQGNSGATPNIVRTPQKQTGILDYLSTLYK